MIDLHKAARFIAEFEGFRSKVYLDVGGVETIGHGFTNPNIIRKYRKSGISEAESLVLLEDLVADFAAAVDDACTADLNPNQHMAYTSLAFNIGVGGFRESTTRARHDAGDRTGAAEAILWWNKVDGREVEGLTRRRRREYDLYLAGEAAPVVPLGDVEHVATIGLVGLNSALCLDVEAESTDNGASILQYPDHDRPNQEFAVVPVPDGGADEVAIICAHSGKVLDVAEYSTEPGARVQQWEYHGGTNQRWRIHSTGNVVEIQSVGSGLFLDVRGGSVDAGADLIQWERTYALNQMFMRVRQERTYALSRIVTPPPPPDPGPAPEPDPGFDVGEALRSLGGFPFGNEEDVYGFQAGFSFWDLAIDGSAGAETVKAIRHSIANGGRCGKYFSFAEFGCRHCGRCRISRVHVRALDTYRERVGPVSIVSGTRCDEHNANVGGATNSQHRPFPNNRGISTATDIPGVLTVGQVAELGVFSGIGYVPSEGNVVVHVDSRGDGPNNTTGASRSAPTTWTYG